MKPFAVYSIYDINIVRAEGSYVFDDQGTKYSDMYGGHAVVSVGHANKRYCEAITDQLAKIGFYSNSVVIEQQDVLAEQLGRLSGKADYSLFMCNSGAEANENALKLASFHTGRKKVVCFSGAFHGRTSIAVAITDNAKIVAPINETDNVIRLPFNDVAALEAEFVSRPDEIAAVIVEGIQGVGGIQIASDEFLKAIRSLCDQYGTVYIADSVQCGCGRSGRYYSHDWAGVDADIYSMAKGIANGFPIGAISIAPKFKPVLGMLGTTFGGNHLACVAASAVAEEMAENNLIEHARQMGEYIKECFAAEAFASVVEVRGRGLMIGIELSEDAGPIRKKLLFDEHIFLGSASNKNVIRLLPALNISREQVDAFFEAFKRVIA